MPLTARQEEELNTQKRARILGLDFIDTSLIANKQVNRGYLSNDELMQFRVIPIFADKYNITFGITNNTSQNTVNLLHTRFLDQRINFALISDTGFDDYMKLFVPPKKVVYQDIDINKSAEVVNTNSESVSKILTEINADDMLAYLVQQAHKLNASDIHIETQTNNVRIRFRIDGVLHPIAEIDMDKYRVLLSAIAINGNISTSSSEPQQGHVSEIVKMSDGKQVSINLRLETTPTVNGMDIVMRLFNMRDEMFTLDRLGLSDSERSVVDEIIKKPSGLVLVVGPTGSGKTTTLYSILKSLSTPERKIITIEDPVEYQFTGVTQISVTSRSSKESNFADRLRAVLRLDPDVVMIGEIRDDDTARTALQAALTGHLVLSTFHASSASAALTRLQDIIGSNPLFISSIRLVMAQRLIRRLDDKTKIQIDIDEASKQKISEIIATLPSNIPKPDINNMKIYKAGSSEENPFGYSGQIAIREQFQMTGEILNLLQNKLANSTEQIEKAAIDSGMRTMLQDGILKVLDGKTTLDELFRVIG